MADETKKAEGHEEHIKGVFSTDIVLTIGAGTTKRKTTQTTLYYIEENEHGVLSGQMLNNNHVPFGPKKVIERDDFLNNYEPQLEVYAKKMLPAVREIKKTLARADRHRKQKDFYSSEFEYQNVLNIDDTNVRATFGLGLSYIERGDKDKADDIFQKLVTLEDAFSSENKHLFNEFGINLRKQEMLDQALKYYAKAFKAGTRDPHLLYNIARIHYQQENLQKAGVFLKKALEMQPDFPEAKKFILHVVKKLKAQKAGAPAPADEAPADLPGEAEAADAETAEAESEE